MYTVDDIKVTLLNGEDVKEFIRNHGITACICYATDEKYAEKVGLSCMKEGHMSGSRGDFFKFEIEAPRFCYDEKTEILTMDGWKYFKDIDDDEIVATRNPNTHEVEFHKINEKIAYPYTGIMHEIKGTNVDIRVTDNHRMYYKKYDVRVGKDDFHVTPIKDITVNRIKLNKEFNFKKDIENVVNIKGYTYQKKQSTEDGVKEIDKYTGDLTLGKNTFFKFLAWYLSDGNTVYYESENKYVINITQTDCVENLRDNTKERIAKLVEDLGFTPVIHKNGVRFNSLTLGRFLKELGTCEKKYIPFNLYNEFNQHYAEIFLKEYFKGDGHIDKNGCGKFYTSSCKLANQLQELCFIAGWTAMVYTRGEKLIGTKQMVCGKEVNVNHLGYVVNVSFSKRNREPHVNLKRNRKTQTVINEMVYCVNVTNHIIFVRRNGVAIWCCNCVDQIVRHEQGVFKNVQSQRYVDMDDDFCIYAPPYVLKNDRLLYRYMKYEAMCREQYKINREIFNGLGVTGEQANDLMRTMLPIGVKSKVRIGFTLEALIHFMHKRLCVRADLPIRKVAELMREEVLKVQPLYEEMLVPQCVDLLYCPEKHSCKKYPSKQELIEKIQK